jgi:hypothetical protein
VTRGCLLPSYMGTVGGSCALSRLRGSRVMLGVRGAALRPHEVNLPSFGRKQIRLWRFVLCAIPPIFCPYIPASIPDSKLQKAAVNV